MSLRKKSYTTSSCIHSKVVLKKYKCWILRCLSDQIWEALQVVGYLSAEVRDSCHGQGGLGWLKGVIQNIRIYSDWTNPGEGLRESLRLCRSCGDKDSLRCTPWNPRRLEARDDLDESEVLLLLMDAERSTPCYNGEQLCQQCYKSAGNTNSKNKPTLSPVTVLQYDTWSGDEVSEWVF